MITDLDVFTIMREEYDLYMNVQKRKHEYLYAGRKSMSYFYVCPVRAFETLTISTFRTLLETKYRSYLQKTNYTPRTRCAMSGCLREGHFHYTLHAHVDIDLYLCKLCFERMGTRI